MMTEVQVDISLRTPFTAMINGTCFCLILII